MTVVSFNHWVLQNLQDYASPPVPCLLDPPLKSYQLLHRRNPLWIPCCSKFSPVGARSRWSTHKYAAVFRQTNGLPLCRDLPLFSTTCIDHLLNLSTLLFTPVHFLVLCVGISEHFFRQIMDIEDPPLL